MTSRNLYIGNIHPDTQTHEIRDIFKRYGTLERCEVRFGGPAYKVAFGFVSYDSITNAELAQRSEHGRIHRGRSLVVEFTKTTPGQNVNRHRRMDSNGNMENGHGQERHQLKSRNRHDLHSGYRRRRSPYDNRTSSRRRSTNDDDRRRQRDRSRSPYDRRSSSKRYHSSSTDDRRRSSYSHKNRK